jgi:ABC-2 family transporter protein
MTWLTWRQHRGEALALGLSVAVLGAILLALGLPMHASYHDGIAVCFDAASTDAEVCSTNIARFQQDFGYTTAVLTLLNVLPFAIGAFLGAPLLARELETGTWQLAWTQAVPRMRWLAVKLSALATLTVALTFALAALTTWYRQPLDILNSRFAPEGFDVEGLVPPAYALFAFTLATAAGSFLRRSLPALAASLVAFVVVRVTVETAVRPRYQTPLTLVRSRFEVTNDWVLDSGFVDAHGHRLGRAEFDAVSDAADAANTNLTTYLHDHGIQGWISYQPADRFWAFQRIEATIFLALAAILLALVVSRVKRRAL